MKTRPSILIIFIAVFFFFAGIQYIKLMARFDAEAELPMNSCVISSIKVREELAAAGIPSTFLRVRVDRKQTAFHALVLFYDKPNSVWRIYDPNLGTATVTNIIGITPTNEELEAAIKSLDESYSNVRFMR